MQFDPTEIRLFIADLHLESADSTRFRRLVELLSHWRSRATGIYLLGDITEMWIGDDDDGELAEALRALLRKTVACCPVYLMHGNRDFLYGQQLATETGVTLLADPAILPDGVLLAHGDAYCIDDVPYQKFRTMVRSAAWQADILGRSLEQRRALGASMRAQSRASNANKTANIMDVNDGAVTAALQASGCHTLVHGHTHRPGQHASPAGKRTVVGSWDGTVGWYALQQGGSLGLHLFSLAHRYGTGIPDPAT